MITDMITALTDIMVTLDLALDVTLILPAMVLGLAGLIIREALK